MTAQYIGPAGVFSASSIGRLTTGKQVACPQYVPGAAMAGDAD